MKEKSHLEAQFALHCRTYGLQPATEYRFHPSRKWRFDFAFPDRLIAVELEGGVWVNGRHTRGSGFIADMEKYNAAAALGWLVFRFSGAEVMKGEAIKLIADVLQSKPQREAVNA